MKISEYGELLRLADALTYVCQSELLWKLYSDAGYPILDSFKGQLHDLVVVVADNIKSNLVE